MVNIRGGGEYGPAWHEQAVRANRHEVAEDFAPVAEHLVNTRVTTAAQLGAMGGSAGGLLIGVMLTKYPVRGVGLPESAARHAPLPSVAGRCVRYYENTEGGHSGASNNAQAAFERALRYEFLLQTLC
jgi:prolyl oligopeptidase PreP (S9A serine peptidase family)